MSILIDKPKMCPKCGANDYYTTLAGFFGFRDRNKISCNNCKYKGEAWEWEIVFEKGLEYKVAAILRVILNSLTDVKYKDMDPMMALMQAVMGYMEERKKEEALRKENDE